MSNPWGYPSGTILRHRKYGWEVRYDYDCCYKDFFLWNGRSLMDLSDWKREEFFPIDHPELF